MTAHPPIALPTHPSTGMGIWVAGAVTALSLHIAVAAFAFAQADQNVDSDDLGAAGITIGLELTSPQAPPSHLPPGIDSEASVNSTPIEEQKALVEEANLPKETPVDDPNPDRQVALHKSEKLSEETPDVKPQEANPAEQSVAQDAMATPSITSAVEDKKSTTTTQGTGESRQRVRVTWQKELVAHLDKHKRYPADRSKKAAQIVLSMNLDRMGRVISTTILKSSGDESFDNAALTMVQRASPVPPPPPLVADEGLSFTLPVVFKTASRN